MTANVATLAHFGSANYTSTTFQAPSRRNLSVTRPCDFRKCFLIEHLERSSSARTSWQSYCLWSARKEICLLTILWAIIQSGRHPGVCPRTAAMSRTRTATLLRRDEWRILQQVLRCLREAFRYLGLRMATSCKRDGGERSPEGFVYMKRVAFFTFPDSCIQMAASESLT